MSLIDMTGQQQMYALFMYCRILNSFCGLPRRTPDCKKESSPNGFVVAEIGEAVIN